MNVRAARLYVTTRRSGRTRSGLVGQEPFPLIQGRTFRSSGISRWQPDASRASCGLYVRLCSFVALSPSTPIEEGIIPSATTLCVSHPVARDAMAPTHSAHSRGHSADWVPSRPHPKTA